MTRMTLEEFHAALRQQAARREDIAFICPMCKCIQSSRDLIAAGAGADFDSIEKYLGFSCVGRFSGAPGPRRKPDGKPCDWTLGGLLSFHELEVITPDGKTHPRFALASKEESEAHAVTFSTNPTS